MSLYEISDPRFSKYIAGNAVLEKLGDGFRWAEGPVWLGDMNALVFSDVPSNRMMMWSEAAGVRVFRDPSEYANGNTRDQRGRLLTCSHLARAIQRTEHDGRVVVLADSFQGRKLNSPNDLVVKSDGSIWFTDPNYGISGDYQGARATQELPCNVYRLDPASGELSVVTDAFKAPNGLAFGAGERQLYIAETGEPNGDPRPHIRVFDVSEDGAQLTNGRIFYEFEHGNADGFRCDEDGNLWCGGPDGVLCLASDGTLLGKIFAPSTVANVAFGGLRRNRLFLCSAQSLHAIYVNTRGLEPPGDALRIS
jgi:gluconolactonase